jgi:sugar lactone lactonase YvrE
MFTPDANGDYSKGTIRTILGTPYSNKVLPYPNGIELAADGKTFYYLENGGKIRKVSYVR